MFIISSILLNYVQKKSILLNDNDILLKKLFKYLTYKILPLQ